MPDWVGRFLERRGATIVDPLNPAHVEISSGIEGAPDSSDVDASDLNEQQLAAVTFRKTHALVLAGAGTGKTRTIIARVAYLIRTGADPRRIAVLTFTRRAADELKVRLRTMLPPGRADTITAGTFHAFALGNMRHMSALFACDQSTVIDRDDAEQLFKLVRAEVGAPDSNTKFPRANELLKLYSYARNTNRPPRLYLERFTEHDEATIEQIVTAFGRYEQRKARAQYLDYDDILFRFAAALNENSAARERVRSRYDEILVDEMQDTNPLQWLILDALRDPARLFCVGDDAQSIYAFRGADFRNIHSFTKRIPDAQTLPLLRNYRSTQEILDLANWLLDDSPLGYDKHLVANRGDGVMPRLLDFDFDLDEAAWIADDLLRRRGEGAAWKDHMILLRAGYAGRAIEALLSARRIPYRFVGGFSLMASAHVKDLLAVLRCSRSATDDLAWIRYLTMWPGIGDVTAGRWIESLREASDSGEIVARLANLARQRLELLDPLRAVVGAPNVGAAIRSVARLLDPIQLHRYERWESRRRDYELMAMLGDRASTVESFLDTYALEPVSEVELGDPDKDVVLVITVHSAKGTEAPVCYLPRCQPGMYPHQRSRTDDEVEEDRRTLYVAITRARDELIVSRTTAQGDRLAYAGGVRFRYFLEELPQGLVTLESHLESSVADDALDDEEEESEREETWDPPAIRPWRGSNT